MIGVLRRDRHARHRARVDRDRSELRERDERRQRREVLVVLGAERSARARVIWGEVRLALGSDLQVLLLVVAEEALVLHRELDALARLGTAVHEIAQEDDAITRGGGDREQKIDRLVVATVQVAYQDCSLIFHGMHGRFARSPLTAIVSPVKFARVFIAMALWVGCSKKATWDDPYAAPSAVALAPAPADAPHATTRLALSPTELKRDTVTLATIAEIRDSAHDDAIQARLATAIGNPADVLLYVDRATPFEVLSSLINLLGAAGVSSDRVELAVAGIDGKTASVRLGPPSPKNCELTFINVVKDAGAPAKRANANEVPCRLEAGLNPIVRVESEGFGVNAGGANLATNCDDIGPGLAVRGHDVSLLITCLDRIKHLHKEFESERSVVVTASPATRFEEIAPVLAGVRKLAGGGDLFPDVTLATR